MNTKFVLVGGIGLAVVMFGSAASAADPGSGTSSVKARSTGDGYTYEFDDDPLAADGSVTQQLRLRVRPPGKFGYLIRPRLHFVQEMVETADDL